MEPVALILLAQREEHQPLEVEGKTATVPALVTNQRRRCAEEAEDHPAMESLTRQALKSLLTHLQTCTHLPSLEVQLTVRLEAMLWDCRLSQ